MTFKLNVASISDIHLGHRQTPTKHIIQNLYAAFPDTEETGQLDMIFIVGDLFDGPLGHYSDEAVEIQLWMYDFLKMCAKREIAVRVLEGTRSHDWRQSVWFNVVVQLSMLPVDLRYVRELSIERMTYGESPVDILYVPDEWRTETDQTWLEVNQLLAEHGISQVDFTLLHGAFAEQLPAQAKCPKHLSERYQSITKHHVFAGHIHQRWVNGNILGNGSFDRLMHGDEGDKGHWRVRYVNEDTKIRFIKNPGAMTFLTVNCAGLSIDEANVKIDAAVSGLRAGSRIRVQSASTDAITSAVDLLRKRHPTLVWTVDATDKKTAQASLLVDHRPPTKGVAITASNLRALIDERLAASTLSPTLLQSCRDVMTQMGLT